MPGGVCCVIGTCCPPKRQAVALANALEIPLDAAQKIAGKRKGEGYLLIPRSLEAGPEALLEGRVTSAKERLANLISHNKVELRSILEDLGHAAEPEG